MTTWIARLIGRLFRKQPHEFGPEVELRAYVNDRLSTTRRVRTCLRCGLSSTLAEGRSCRR